MLTALQFRILKWIAPGTDDSFRGSTYEHKSKLATLLGAEFFNRIARKLVIDFGCGDGTDAVEMAARGAGRVIGIDIREEILHVARQNAVAANVQDKCTFTLSTEDRADIIVSLDAFEHFADPLAILVRMSELLKPSGEALLSFGPTWYHPLGGHLFSVFPWSHILFSEKALIRWRSTFKTDGATRFGEVAGGLNQMTIARFEQLVAQSPFRCASLELVPIRPLRRFHNRLTREFTTAIVRARLVRRSDAVRQ
jgi:SAM-dependent methyltransferase